MIRISLFLPNSLVQRVAMDARLIGKSHSDIIRLKLERAYQTEQQAHLSKIAESLRALKGIGTANVSNASETVDEVLYGEHGAWRGTIPTDDP
jgi:negative regulator of replication initiation